MHSVRSWANASNGCGEGPVTGSSLCFFSLLLMLSLRMDPENGQKGHGSQSPSRPAGHSIEEHVVWPWLFDEPLGRSCRALRRPKGVGRWWTEPLPAPIVPPKPRPRLKTQGTRRKGVPGLMPHPLKLLGPAHSRIVRPSEPRKGPSFTWR